MKLKNEMYNVVGLLPSDGKSEFGIRIMLNDMHEIYKAHFPDNPITPGVCVVKILTELLESHLSRPLFLNEINNLKFVSVISPIDDTVVDIVFSKVDAPDDFCKTKGTICKGNKIYTKFSFTYGYNQI